MKPRLILTGPIGCGKSTLIRDALAGAAQRAGGFITVRVSENGELRGFELLPARFLENPKSCGCARRFLSFSPGGAARDDEVFRDYATRLLREAVGAPFAVADEFGGFEIMLPEFCSALDGLLESGTPCVGVLKALPAAGELQARVDVDPGYIARARLLRQRLLDDGDTELLETTGRYDARAENALRLWAEEYAMK